jgi:hypothetical protein
MVMSIIISTFTVAGITRNFEAVYYSDQRDGIAALSTSGIVDGTLLAAANAALAQFVAAAAIVDSIDAAVQSAVQSNGAGVMSVVYGDTPIYGSFEVNGSGILLNENPNDPKGRPQKVMQQLIDAVEALWYDAIRPFVGQARTVTTLLTTRLAAFTAAVAAASPSDSKTASQALMAAMTPISDTLLGVGTVDPFFLRVHNKVLPFALPTLPNLQVT